MAGFRGLEGRSVLVTGAASGIGRAIAQRLGEEGAVVGILDRDRAGADETAEPIRGAGAEAHVFEVDITDAAAVEEAVSSFAAAAGGVQGLVNNAGWDLARPFLETDAELWRKERNRRSIRPSLYTRHPECRRAESHYTASRPRQNAHLPCKSR